ncbi:MAG: hypothetical protein HC906_05495 [Bacteroidales bacterium]|nr:hypothetical protein [Bacteroidales bacterium]
MQMYPAQLKSLLLVPVSGKHPQKINMDYVGIKKIGDGPFSLSANASSGLDIRWELISGPAELNGNVLTITGAGWINCKAYQQGNETYYPVSENISIRVDEGTNLDIPKNAEKIIKSVS